MTAAMQNDANGFRWKKKKLESQRKKHGKQKSPERNSFGHNPIDAKEGRVQHQGVRRKRTRGAREEGVEEGSTDHVCPTRRSARAANRGKEKAKEKGGRKGNSGRFRGSRICSHSLKKMGGGRREKEPSRGKSTSDTIARGRFKRGKNFTGTVGSGACPKKDKRTKRGPIIS